MFSVELLADGETEAAMRGDWQRLIEADLPSAGRHPSESNRPHVTVAVRDELAEDAADRLAMLGEVLPVACRVGGVVVFPARDRFVLARPVIVTADLLHFHARTVGVLGPPPEDYAVTAIDRWTPHITLARRMTAEQVGRALEVVGAASVEGRFTGLRLWDAQQKVITELR
ncbi:2'-5' RNA ligase family protein [Microbacterium arborescens]|uniref:2'-5' RNA ligase family protein n=1 Tax=Microbacterium arborescens TaxID=33883 RepID=UPI003C7614BC